jgi:hypothetical protein
MQINPYKGNEKPKVTNIVDSLIYGDNCLVDNTLTKYFFPENEKSNKQREITRTNENKIISLEKMEKMFKKVIKLRNALKQSYWDRSSVLNKVFLFILRIVQIFCELLMSYQKYN